jgi:hypothetical protein
VISLDTAAANEKWTESDWHHAGRIVKEAFEDTFEVKMIQQTGIGLIAYGASFVNFENVLFAQGEPKPVLRALGELSQRLLRVKIEMERQEDASDQA